MDELVLVIPATKLFERGVWNGLRTQHMQWYRRLVDRYGVFKKRSNVEEDPTFKQIIPQILFVHRKNMFLHRIHTTASESRLHGQFEMFLGGHINPIDRQTGKKFLDVAAEREFQEEVLYHGGFIRKQFVGVINRGGNRMVDRVHVGFLYIFQGKDPAIMSRESKVEEVGLLDISELKSYVPHMTQWSQIVYPHLKEFL